MTEADKDHALLAVKAFEAAVNAPHLVALVRAGAIFINGKLVERPGQDYQPKPPYLYRSVTAIGRCGALPGLWLPWFGVAKYAPCPLIAAGPATGRAGQGPGGSPAGVANAASLGPAAGSQ